MNKFDFHLSSWNKQKRFIMEYYYYIPCFLNIYIYIYVCVCVCVCVCVFVKEKGVKDWTYK